MGGPPRLRGSLPVRLGLLVAGLFIFAAGIVALLESRLGLSPWDVLHQGIARHTPLSFGQASIAASVLVAALAWRLGARLGFGTLANAVLVGLFVDLLASLDGVAALAHDPMPVRVGLLVGGIGLMGAGTGFYVGAGLGAGPRDSLMVVGARRARARIRVVRATIELSVLGVGVLLGGTVGVGTLAFAVGIGPVVETWFGVLARSPLGRRDAPPDAGVPARAHAEAEPLPG